MSHMSYLYNFRVGQRLGIDRFWRRYENHLTCLTCLTYLTYLMCLTCLIYLAYLISESDEDWESIGFWQHYENILLVSSVLLV
jgi:hypothetical protein